jgi:hypothetical protein
MTVARFFGSNGRLLLDCDSGNYSREQFADIRAHIVIHN